MLLVKKFIFNPFYENTYIVWDKETKEGMVIDPGCYTEDEKTELKEYIVENKITVKYLVLTHCHLDHILGCKFVKEQLSPLFLIPLKDQFLLDEASIQAELFQIKIEDVPKPDLSLDENSILQLGKSQPIIFHTPGHTPGEYSLLFEEEKFCITGDVLFKESIGRTDLWGGDMKALLNSIKTKLLVLDDEIRIYPGHGDESTIGEERRNNPFLKDLSAEGQA